MKRKRSFLPFYIIILPIAGLAALLGSGILLQFMDAVTIGEYRYTSAAYNYYYYEQYHTFIDENYEDLKELGFDYTVDESKQQYDQEMTWQEYFSFLAEERMLEVTALNMMAEEVGYVFGEEELALIDEKIGEMEAEMLEENFTDPEEYLVSYYNAGMKQEIFEEQLTFEVKADIYKEVLSEKLDLTQSEVEEYLTSNPEKQKVCEVRIIALYPSTDRYTGEVQGQQWEDLSNKMTRLLERYQASDTSQEAFAELAKKYSEMYETASAGGLYRADMNSEEEIAQWCFAEERVRGDVGQVKTQTGEYLLYYLDGSEEIVQETAEEVLKEAKLEILIASILEESVIKKHSLGMKLCM